MGNLGIKKIDFARLNGRNTIQSEHSVFPDIIPNSQTILGSGIEVHTQATIVTAHIVPRFTCIGSLLFQLQVRRSPVGLIEGIQAAFFHRHTVSNSFIGRNGHRLSLTWREGFVGGFRFSGLVGKHHRNSLRGSYLRLCFCRLRFFLSGRFCHRLGLRRGFRCCGGFGNRFLHGCFCFFGGFRNGIYREYGNQQRKRQKHRYQAFQHRASLLFILPQSSFFQDL